MQTISSDSASVDHHEHIALYLSTLLTRNHFFSEIVHGYGNPVVLWRYIVNAALPTVLVYGHYDVQPANSEEWRKHDPFSLYIGKDKIYGRGVADNKWQFLIHLLAIFDLIESDTLWYNVVVLLEGNEETWSQDLEKFLLDHIHDVHADFFLVSDSYILWNSPCIDLWYRWGINVALRLTTASTDLHSWLYGGIVPNAIHEMNTILHKLYDVHHRVTIPYFYYDVEDIPFDILVKNKKLKFDEQTLMTDFAVKTLFKDKTVDLFTQLGLKPTIQVTWIAGGYTGDGYKNAIPNTATAHINFRIVKKQTTKNVLGSFDQRLQTVLPAYVEYDLTVGDMYEPVKIQADTPYIKRAEDVLQRVFAKPVIYKYSWWGLPIVDTMQKIIRAYPVLIPLVNEDCNAHGVNENFDIDLIEKGFQFSHDFFSRS